MAVYFSYFGHSPLYRCIFLLAASKTSAGGSVCHGVATSTDTSNTVIGSTASHTRASRRVHGSGAGSTGTSSTVCLDFIPLEGKQCSLAASSTSTAGAMTGTAGNTGTCGTMSADATTAEAIGTVGSLTIGTGASRRVTCCQSTSLAHGRACKGSGSKAGSSNGHARHGQ